MALTRVKRFAVPLVLLIGAAWLAAIWLINVERPFDEVRREHARQQLSLLTEAAVQYRATHGRCAATLQDLLPINRIDAVDPWDRPYAYRCDEQAIEIRTYGADGLVDGEGENADVVMKR